MWVFIWFHLVDFRLGFFVRLGLRYRLLWFWVGFYLCVLGGFRVEV